MSTVNEWTSQKIGMTVVLALVPLILSFAVGLWFRPDAWYWNLKKPCAFPSSFVFIVVWTILYPLIGAAAAVALYNTGTSSGWWTLPVLNIIISLMFAPVFFGMHSIVGGVFITFLSFALGFGVFWQYAVAQKDYTAAGMMIPYAVWTLFALFLIWSVYQLNCCQPVVCKTIRRSVKHRR